VFVTIVSNGTSTVLVTIFSSITCSGKAVAPTPAPTAPINNPAPINANTFFVLSFVFLYLHIILMNYE